MRGFICAAVAAFIAAVPTISQAQMQTKSVAVSSPQAGVLSNASAGEVLWSLEMTPVTTNSRKIFKLSSKIKVVNLMKGIVVIPEDSVFSDRSIGRTVIVCTKLNVLLVPSRPCLYDHNSDGVFDSISLNNMKTNFPLKTPTAYTVENETETIHVGDKFKQVIVYLGVSGNSLSLSYKEFQNDYARPSFTDAMQIPLSPKYPQVVKVKGVVMTINKIDGMGIEYVIK